MVADFTGMRDPKRVGFPIHVKAGHPGQHYPRVEVFGIWLTRKHLDVVSLSHQTATEVTDVYPLAAAMCLAAIGQQSNPHTHAHSGMALPAGAAAERLARTSASCMDTCLDYSLTS